MAVGGHLGRLSGGLDGHVGGEVASLADGVTWGTWSRVGRGYPGKRTWLGPLGTAGRKGIALR